MPKRIPNKETTAILAAVEGQAEGASRAEIAKTLRQKMPPRTLQFRLKNLVTAGLLVTEGESRAVRYRLAAAGETPPDANEPSEAKKESGPALSKASERIQQHLQQPVTARKPVGYNRAFLDSYRPNETPYLSRAERARLAETGRSSFASDVAGTYA